MRAGRLNRRVELQRPSHSQDGVGQDQRRFTPAATVWAAVEPLKGEELFQAQKLVAEVTTRIVLRYRKDIDATWRVKFRDRLLKVESVINPRSDLRELQLMCKEIPTGEPV